MRSTTAHARYPWVLGVSLLLPAAPAAALCAAIVCADPVTVSNNPNQCGAVVDYPLPAPFVIPIPSGGCGTITCSPPPGSFFPRGTTGIVCSSSAGPTCDTSAVTVLDTQPPQISTSDVPVAGTAPGESTVANYPPPTASDNCPGVTFLCTPASGSSFPSGPTDVTCTATDSSGNTASTQFTLRNFDACVQDDVGGEFVRWSTADGFFEYSDCGESVCGAPVTQNGTGTATPTAAGFALQHVEDGRSVRASLKLAAGKGNARVKFTTGSSKLAAKLKDASFLDDTCSCP
jgi:hypothetical protein